MPDLLRPALILLLVLPLASGQETSGHHSAAQRSPEHLGKVSFPVSCTPAAQQEFNRGIALLHSFDYGAARAAFQAAAGQDPHCAMAHWGIAATWFHQLWEPPLAPQDIASGRSQIQLARQIGAPSQRERGFIDALAAIYQDDATVPYRTRALNYERAMRNLAAGNPHDLEAQVFYALALLANAPPGDKTHARQKQALQVLEPLSRAYPQHPGIPHYLIHACDNAELAARGLAAAKAYALIAPSAPHALHMPSHIFTRLGMWDDSVRANQAARQAAREQSDTGEELHAMDYLVYAYLQQGNEAGAARILGELKQMRVADAADFKIAYASTAMPVRYAVERRSWAEAASIVTPAAAPPQVQALAVWARGLGLARTGQIAPASQELAQLHQIQEQLRVSGKDYWAAQTGVLAGEVAAWLAQAEHRPKEALDLLRHSADEEDAMEKLPVTPGPVLPAREQLGDLLLELNQPALAATEFHTSLASAPGRRGSLQGAARAAELLARK